jgi:tetratricopeptide (TPR) repeat protein
MPSHNDPVKPTPFDTAKPTPAATASSPAGTPRPAESTPRWVLPALAALLALVVAVVVWLPASLQSDGPAAEAVADDATPSGTAPAGAGTATQTVEKNVAPAASPWSDAQAARLRREAQETAAELLDLQFELRETGVERWAPEPFANVQRLAEDGDAHYRDQHYEQANTLYQEGLSSLQALQAGLPQTLATLLEQAREAIEVGDAAAAGNALELSLLIAPDSSAAATLQTRLETLPRLLTLLEAAAASESRDELAGAEDALQQAAKLDPQHQYTAAELKRVSAAAAKKAFNAAMSEGYAALDEGRYNNARTAFRQAATLQSGSTEAASALQEVETAETARKLGSLDSRGKRYEQGEQWQKAVDTYKEAQKTDSSVLFASEGLQRSRGRAQLNRDLQTVLDEPDRLANTSVAQGAARLLERARTVSPRGTVLTGQIAQLDSLLAEANREYDITLRSDGETEIIVYKVARLGRFTQRELTLRPGTYTAVGTRDGYRDVRRQFTIKRNGIAAPVNIVCSEPI